MEISVCMIVRDEAKNLPNILNIVQKFADEIIIVDTGSKDETISIAKMFTNNVYNFTWCNDFSKARNFSFSKTTRDYIMWLDADDYIDDTNVQKILNLKNTTNPLDLYMMKYTISNASFSYYRERLLKRSNNYIWSGFVHEAITPTGRVEYLDITIQHKKTASSNPKRNLNLYRYHKKQNYKFNAREQYYYAKELYYNGYYASAIRELKKFLAYKNKFLPNHYDAILTLARIYNHKSQHNLSINILADFIKTYTPTSEICCELGNAFIKSHRINDAIMAYEAALTIPPNLISGAFVEYDYYYLIPHLQLVCLYYKKGNYELSKYHHNILINQYPSHPSVIYNQQFFTKF